MAKCEKCEGQGWKDNPRYWNMSATIAWERGIPSRINCRECKGTGYVIGDVKDAIDTLRAWKNNPQGITNKEFKQAIEILEKLFDEKIPLELKKK